MMMNAQIRNIAVQTKRSCDCFFQASCIIKKLLLAQIIGRIEVGRDYEVPAKFRISAGQFINHSTTSRIRRNHPKTFHAALQGRFIVSSKWMRLKGVVHTNGFLMA